MRRIARQTAHTVGDGATNIKILPFFTREFRRADIRAEIEVIRSKTQSKHLNNAIKGKYKNLWQCCSFSQAWYKPVCCEHIISVEKR